MTQPIAPSTDRNIVTEQCFAEVFDTKHIVLTLGYPVKDLAIFGRSHWTSVIVTRRRTSHSTQVGRFTYSTISNSGTKA